MFRIEFSQNNILIGRNGEPLICDFGCSRLSEETGFTRTSLGVTLRYMAPEIVGDAVRADPENYNPKPAKEGDVYSFGILALEVRFLTAIIASSEVLAPCLIAASDLDWEKAIRTHL
jgi:serine/threonine protein kinase